MRLHLNDTCTPPTSGVHEPHRAGQSQSASSKIQSSVEPSARTARIDVRNSKIDSLALFWLVLTTSIRKWYFATLRSFVRGLCRKSDYPPSHFMQCRQLLYGQVYSLHVCVQIWLFLLSLTLYLKFYSSHSLSSAILIFHLTLHIEFIHPPPTPQHGSSRRQQLRRRANFCPLCRNPLPRNPWRRRTPNDMLGFCAAAR